MCRSSKLHTCFRDGDYKKLKEITGHINHFPDCDLGPSFGHILEYAIYHSPLPMLKTLLRNGADPNYKNNNGFPSIIAALSSERENIKEIILTLLKYGADINQRGLNDWTPLHWAASHNNVEMIKFLLKMGADPTIRTSIDDNATALEEAQRLGCDKAVEFFKKHT